jgi:hypothetical protein
LEEGTADQQVDHFLISLSAFFDSSHRWVSLPGPGRDRSVLSWDEIKPAQGGGLECKV